MGNRTPRGTGPALKVIAVLCEPGDVGEVRDLIDSDYEFIACDGDQARAAIADESVAAVLVDASSGGLALLAELRDLRPNARRVLVARNGDPEGLEVALREAAVDYVVRPPLARQHIAKAIALLLTSFDQERASQSILASIRTSALEGSDSTESFDRALRRLRVPMHRDPATGLYNATSFYERVREEVARARRYRKSLTLVHIAQHANSESPEVVEHALTELAVSLRSAGSEACIRESDVLGRVGPSEIAIMLPETDRAGGRIKAQRIRSLRDSLRDDTSEGVSLTIGVASFPEDARGPAELMQLAIIAQRAAHEAGGAHVGVCPGLGDELAHERLQFTYYHGHLEEITTTLEEDRSASVLFCDLSHLRKIEREFGVSTHSELFARAGALLADTRGSCLRREDRLFRTEDADGYLCFLAPPRDANGLSVSLDLETIAKRVQSYLEKEIAEDIGRLTSQPIRVVVGYARVLANPMARSERLVLQAIADARESARLVSQRKALRAKAALQEIILRDQLRAVYQPIVALESGDIFGFEALTRGPAETQLESPLALFGVADEVDLTFELDRACFRNGLRSAVGISPVHRLFVNLLPQSFYDTRFIESEVERLLETAGLTPANVVFEITERLAIENFTAFCDALTTYTAMGFGVAIDDVGTRHSNLETVMALQPHFIKVSDILTRGVSRSTVKREMLRSLQRIADTIDAVIVAEGIEDTEDLEVLVELGIRYGQGFYLGRPAPAFPEILLERQREIRSIASDPKNRRTAQLEVIRLQDKEQTAEHVVRSGEFGRGSGEFAAAPDPRRTEETSPHIILPAQQPWRPLADEELGDEGESSLLDALRAAERHKRSAQN